MVDLLLLHGVGVKTAYIVAGEFAGDERIDVEKVVELMPGLLAR